jgi:hypothetical protein
MLPFLGFAAMNPEWTQSFFKSGRPLLLGTGLNEEIVDLLERETTDELMEARYPHWLRLRCVYATKKCSN